MAALGALDAVCLILLRACLKTTWFEVAFISDLAMDKLGVSVFSSIGVPPQLGGSTKTEATSILFNEHWHAVADPTSKTITRHNACNDTCMSRMWCLEVAVGA